MLQAFNDRIRNSRWLGYLIVGLISIPFALWGIQSYMGGTGGNDAAEVNGEPIPLSRVQRMASQQRQQLRQRFGGTLPEGFGQRLFLERALSEAIDREVLRQAAVEAGLRITDEGLRRSIRQQDMFRRDGAFDRELYRELLSRNGLSPQQYEADVRSGLAIQQLQRGIAGSGFVLTGEARSAARFMHEERKLSLLVHSREAASAGVKITDEEVREYYENNGDQFQQPAQVRIAYVELDMARLKSTIEVTKKEMRAEYEANMARFRGQEERKASHILLEVDSATGDDAEQQAREKARDLRARLKEGADFAELTREHSDDAGSAGQGGNLGYVSRGSMVEAFEEALFSLEDEGDVSEPVRSPYGYHLIRLDDVRKGESRSFEQVRDSIKQDIRARRAERLFYDRVESLRNSSYEQPGSLEPAAEAAGLEIRTSDWFSRQSGEGIASSPEVRETAFSDQVRIEGLNSDLIELGPRHVLVLRVRDERPAQPKSFDEVRDEVEQRLHAERTDSILQQWVETTRARLDEGAEVTSLTEKEAVSQQEPGWIGRSEEDGEIDTAIREKAFTLPVPTGEPVHGTVELGNGDRAVVIVKAARLPDVDARTVAEVRRQQSQSRVRGEVRAYIAALRDAADISRNKEALSRR